MESFTSVPIEIFTSSYVDIDSFSCHAAQVLTNAWVTETLFSIQQLWILNTLIKIKYLIAFFTMLEQYSNEIKDFIARFDKIYEVYRFLFSFCQGHLTLTSHFLSEIVQLFVSNGQINIAGWKRFKVRVLVR